MKYIFITFFLLVVGIVSGSTQADAVTCQNGTAIVYGNGMFNSWDDSNASLKKLEKKVHIHLQALPPTQFTVAELEFHLAYVNDSGGFAAGVGTGLEQLLKVVKQKVAGSATDIMWLWLSGVTKIITRKLPPPAALAIDMVVPNSPPPWFRLAMRDIAAKANAVAYVNDVDLFNQINGDPLVVKPKLRFDGYKYLLNSGKRIVIVSHSQGNFYANRVYQVLTDPITGNAAFAASIGNVAVATPSSTVLAGKIAFNEPYVTVPEDLVIAGVRAVAPTLPAKGGLPAVSNAFSQNMLDLRVVAWANASAGHNFVQWYLAGTYTRDFIMKGIVDTINGVNGVGGLQYPTQGCTVAGPVATIPQPGPYYFRDDWGVFTFYMSGSNRQSHLKTRSAWARFKNLRDEQKGLAYHIDLDLSQTAPFLWQLPEKASVLITDYTSLAKQTIPVTFTRSFKPQDVLLWKGGLIFLSFDHRGYDALTAYHRDNIVRVSWRKLTIVDHGAAAATRWTLKPVQSGVFSMPTYTATQQGWGTMPNGSSVQKWVASNNNQWNKLGVSFRDGMTYTYRIPFSASEAYWTNAPTTPFGWINGVNVAPPNPTDKNYLGDYGVLEVIDGLLSFTPLGQVPLHSTGTKQSGMVPQINTFGGIEQTRAYQDTQGIVNKAALVEEASQPNWRIVGNPPAVGAPPLGMLKSTLPANGLFFNPRTWTRYYGTTPRIPTAIFQVFTYSQIYVPYSLSNQMAGARAEVVYAPKINVSQGASFYKLGQTFAVPYNTYPFPIPVVTRGDKSFYCAVGVTPCFPGGIYGISVSAAQQAAMISPIP